ncbi:MAG: TlpA family protein disulfide reductase [Deltaproteobacteria bacterium]|nr:TlpA family protein disulfide reductase [Deltaproteobacteria bacterium]
MLNRSRWFGFAPLLTAVGLVMALAGCGSTAPASTASPTVVVGHAIVGQVLAHDGRTLADGRAQLRVPGPRGVVTDVELADDGALTLETDYVGFAWLELSGVAHAPTTIPVVLGPEPISIDVRLGTNDYRKAFGELRLTVRRGDGVPRYVRARAVGDGTFEAVLDQGPGPVEIAWSSALAGCCGETLAGTVALDLDQPPRFVPDGAGRFRQVLDLGPGPTRLVFDPQTLAAAGLAATIDFDPPDGPAARVASIVTQTQEREQQFSEQLLAEVRRGGEAGRTFVAHYPWDRQMEPLAAMARAEPDPSVQRVGWVGYFARPPSAEPSAREREVAAAVMDAVPPTDPAWDFGRIEALLRAAEGIPGAQTYAQRVVDGHPDPGVVSVALWARAGWSSRTTAQREADRVALRSERFRPTEGGRRIAAEDGAVPDLRRPLPSFELTTLDGSGSIASNSLRGGLHLISFWATWCEPCVDEMPALHALHDRFAEAAGLQIVSVVVSDEPEQVARFRALQFPMPWRHARVDTADKGALWSMLELDAMPAAVLVDDQGAIVASGSPEVVHAMARRLLSETQDGLEMDLEGRSPEEAKKIREQVRALEAMAAAQAGAPASR